MREEGLKDNVEEEAWEEEEETPKQEEEKTEDNGLIATENERAWKGAYISFVIPGIPKVDIDGYID